MRKPTLFSKMQLIGIGVLAVVIPLIYVFMHFLPRWIPATTSEESLVLAQQCIDSIEAHYRAKQQKYAWKYQDVPITLQPFDPNIADSITFRELGLPPWMARNILRYRSKGGMFRDTESFRKVYGMNDSIFKALQPYIQIDSLHIAQLDSMRRSERKILYDSLYRRPDTITHIYPIKRDTILELNSADTATLQLIRGIGRYSAVQIVHYRKQLGGYSSVEQLREIPNLPTIADSLFRFFTVCSDSIQPIPVNRASVERLNRHPYLTFTQAKAIYTLRRENIRLEDLESLKETGAFSEEDLSRLKPYLSFE